MRNRWSWAQKWDLSHLSSSTWKYNCGRGVRPFLHNLRKKKLQKDVFWLKMKKKNFIMTEVFTWKGIVQFGVSFPSLGALKQCLWNYILGRLSMGSCFAFSGRLIKHQPIGICCVHSMFQAHDPGPRGPLGPVEETHSYPTVGSVGIKRSTGLGSTAPNPAGESGNASCRRWPELSFKRK